MIFSRELIFSNRISTHKINRYPAIGSPCLHLLPTFILGVGIPFIIMTDSKFFIRVSNQAIVELLKFNSFNIVTESEYNQSDTLKFESAPGTNDFSSVLVFLFFVM